MRQRPDSVAASAISDAELLHSIRMGLDSTYRDVLKKPMPRTIEALLARLEEGEAASTPSTSPAWQSPAGDRPDRGNSH